MAENADKRGGWCGVFEQSGDVVGAEKYSKEHAQGEGAVDDKTEEHGAGNVSTGIADFFRHLDGLAGNNSLEDQTYMHNRVGTNESQGVPL